MDEVKIEDIDEFNKQKEEYLKSLNGHIELKIVVGAGESSPISEIHGKNIDNEDIARLIAAMFQQLQFLKEASPEAFELSKLMKKRVIKEDINVDKGEEDEETNE